MIVEQVSSTFGKTREIVEFIELILNDIYLLIDLLYHKKMEGFHFPYFNQKFQRKVIGTSFLFL